MIFIQGLQAVAEFDISASGLDTVITYNGLTITVLNTETEVFDNGDLFGF